TNAGVLSIIVLFIIGGFLLTRVPENMVGRVNGTILPLFMGAMLIGTSLAGGLKELTSLVTVFCIAMAL
ncbi:MFS transporter, partial [Bacillus thuringiensis]|nr:MFS transporter [Bacillus thuringiensis]